MRSKAQRAFDICKADDYLRKATRLLDANHLLSGCQEAELRDLRKHCDDEIGRLSNMEIIDPEEEAEGIIPF